MNLQNAVISNDLGAIRGEVRNLVGSAIRQVDFAGPDVASGGFARLGLEGKLALGYDPLDTGLGVLQSAQRQRGLSSGDQEFLRDQVELLREMRDLMRRQAPNRGANVARRPAAAALGRRD